MSASYDGEYTVKNKFFIGSFVPTAQKLRGYGRDKQYMIEMRF